MVELVEGRAELVPSFLDDLIDDLPLLGQELRAFRVQVLLAGSDARIGDRHKLGSGGSRVGRVVELTFVEVGHLGGDEGIQRPCEQLVDLVLGRDVLGTDHIVHLLADRDDLFRLHFPSRMPADAWHILELLAEVLTPLEDPLGEAIVLDRFPKAGLDGFLAIAKSGDEAIIRHRQLFFAEPEQVRKRVAERLLLDLFLVLPQVIE
jgi:hypothetical protein